MGVTNGYTEILEVRQIDFNNNTDILYEIELFTATYAYATVEYALVITPAGNIYSLRGNETMVNPGIINRDELVGSIIIHNHPPEHLQSTGDSFSQSDFLFAAEFKINRQYLVSGTRRNILILKNDYTTAAAYNIWEQAKQIMLQRAISSGNTIINRQAQTLEILYEISKGVVFYDEF